MNNNEVIIERLDTLIKQNTNDHKAICIKQDKTNGNVKLNTVWRYMIVGMGTVITGAVIPLVVYIAMSFDKKLEREIENQTNTAELVQQLAHDLENGLEIIE